MSGAANDGLLLVELELSVSELVHLAHVALPRVSGQLFAVLAEVDREAV